jgi:asparagine synthetase B (glutamine-hydrolysing)
LEEGIVKSNDASPFFIARNPIPKTKTIIGHTRNPSINTPKEEEHAHPYEFDNIYGVHNGFFSDHYKIQKEYGLEGTMTDSYPILYAINKDGFEKVGPALSERSSFALSWLDRKSGILYLYRSAKELHYGQKDSGIYVASEKSPLEAIGVENIKLVPFEMLGSLKDGEMVQSKKISLRKDPYQHYNHGWGHGHYPNIHSTTYDSKTKENIKVEKNIPIIDSQEAPENADFIWYKGNKCYFWSDGLMVFVEEIKGFKDSKLSDYDMGKHVERELLGREYLPVLQQFNADLENEINE